MQRFLSPVVPSSYGFESVLFIRHVRIRDHFVLCKAIVLGGISNFFPSTPARAALTMLLTLTVRTGIRIRSRLSVFWVNGRRGTVHVTGPMSHGGPSHSVSLLRRQPGH